MAAPDFGAPYQYQTMSTGPGAQGVDVSASMSPVAPTFQQHQGWQREQYQTFHNQSYDPYFPPSQYRSSQSFRELNHPRSPYAVHGGFHMPTYYSPPVFSFASHQPRPPPAIRSGYVDTLMDSSRSGADVYRGAPAIFGPGYQRLFPPTNGHSPYTMPAPPAAMLEITSNESFHRGQSVQTMSDRGSEQSHQTLPLHPRLSQSHQPTQSYQNQQRQTNRNAGNRHSDDTERRPTVNLTTQARRSDRSFSPRTSARRSFERYSGDLPRSSTSSDAEEAAARSPPSNRVRHRPREGRPRFFSSQFCDPNVITNRQIQDLKTGLSKFLVGELPEDTSPTCDICAKDYSATHVQPSEEEEVAVKLPCGHSFGEFCISQWFDTCKTHKNKVTCPMCRKQLIEPPSSPYAANYLHMYAVRNSQPFQELLANELQAQYAHA